MRHIPPGTGTAFAIERGGYTHTTYTDETKAFVGSASNGPRGFFAKLVLIVFAVGCPMRTAPRSWGTGNWSTEPSARSVAFYRAISIGGTGQEGVV